MTTLAALLDKVNLGRRLRERFDRVERSTDAGLALLQKDLARVKAMLKRQLGEPIHVVFVCHQPSVWGSLESVHSAITSDPAFRTTIVVAPYRHTSFGDLEYHDGGMREFCQSKGLSFIPARSNDRDWLDLQSLAPDYVFFQTPYDAQFPEIYHATHVARFAKVCYVPYYGVLLYEGVVDQITHPQRFFRGVEYAFVGETTEKENLLHKFSPPLQARQVVVAGSPKVDYIFDTHEPAGTAWPRGCSQDVKRVLWTPRWKTSEGNCHFFDYRHTMLDFAQAHPDIDFVFRPHPLSLQNFIKSGELSQDELDAMLARYEAQPNAAIDRSGEYQDTFRSCDVLVSDMSSMLHEFFMTGKPIIYTHRVDCFNEFGSILAEGFYWVRDWNELDSTLEMLLAGKDPMKPKRQAILERVLGGKPRHAGTQVMQALKEDFLATAGLAAR